MWSGCSSDIWCTELHVLHIRSESASLSVSFHQCCIPISLTCCSYHKDQWQSLGTFKSNVPSEIRVLTIVYDMNSYKGYIFRLSVFIFIINLWRFVCTYFPFFIFHMLWCILWLWSSVLWCHEVWYYHTTCLHILHIVMLIPPWKSQLLCDIFCSLQHSSCVAWVWLWGAWLYANYEEGKQTSPS